MIQLQPRDAVNIFSRELHFGCQWSTRMRTTELVSYALLSNRVERIQKSARQQRTRGLRDLQRCQRKYVLFGNNGLHTSTRRLAVKPALRGVVRKQTYHSY
jgi:hypothetical protein